jgi:hypothetical protein
MIRASTLVKTAALAMVGTSLLIFPAAAQQMAVNSADFSACDKMSATNPAGAIQCRIATLNEHAAAARRETAVAEKRIRTAEKRIAAADAQITEGDCATQLVEVAKIPAKQAHGAALLQGEGKDVESYGACRLLGQLTP